MFKRLHAPRHVWTHVASLGIRMHARAWFGSPEAFGGLPVVLLHGLGFSSRYMVPLGRRLAEQGYDVIAPDLPGFGRSPRPVGMKWPAGPSVSEQADHVLAWMDACAIQRAVLFGNSLGTQVAVEVATRAPERVERLILSGPTPDPLYRSPGKQYARVLMNMPFEAPCLNAITQLDYASAGIPRIAQQLSRTVDDPIEDILPAIQAPTLVIRGQHDQTLSQPWAETFTRLLPNGQLVVIDKAAHNVHYTAAQVTARLVQCFLQGALDNHRGDEVIVPTLKRDPLAPPKPITTAVHGVLDYATSLLCLGLSQTPGLGSRTRKILAYNGASATLYSLFTNYELGALRKLPMTVHLNLDTMSGVKLLLASLTLLRREPLPGKLTIALLGALELLVVSATQLPMGPARLIRIQGQNLYAET
ncbi:pimeloyl-ACP methyl ester carboxylesterase [Pseudomonas duriflava]|uniref:Pimeloyl-ACP methyl ester carboxylesterase n=1 Tax=Pseudomonas duriflava TaxID=459528 RepID=A0A562Q6L1_9PSED|nr:alpha/beta hydrolase [Pseudomonas duriflava]TWI52363.1 pimeloyl-ACP methyl ester carboxylesterase [Pseudomonas duriflava]